MSQDTPESYLQLVQQQDRAGRGEWAHLTGLLGEDASAASEAGNWASMQFRGGQQHAEEARQQPEDDPQKLFTEACLHGLRARLCEDVTSLDSFLPPHVARLARKVAEVLEEPRPATA